MEKEVGELGLQRFIRARIFGVSPKDLFRGAQAACLRCLAACRTQLRRQAADECRLAACAPRNFSAEGMTQKQALG